MFALVFMSVTNLLSNKRAKEVNENNFHPSVVLMPFDHQEEGFALKSPVVTQKCGLQLLMPLKSFSKIDTMIISQIHYYFG